MSDPGPRPGYNRDQPMEIKSAYIDPGHDPVVVNWSFIGQALAVLGALGGFLIPASIIVWRIAL